ncbi:TetR/AcrR family transcriptional regulator [Rahnella sp. SL6]|uniref:acrylate utilization transcriptional regulator AcuR n=1 Tax=Rahnella perminowiae TaxID=2816244 RepID=UPI001C25E1B9|nr:TetR/AcrR family transcriptional regulator [Rahnella perminowiae]MBU9809098.1 TetR/AcrR family transcriptional regulator [Rahnella perminowiae]
MCSAFFPEPEVPLKPRRGRPPRTAREFEDTREALIRSGLEVITETGYLSAGIEAVIKNIAVPKGSFYHYFKNKQDFGMAVLTAYGAFFAHKLDKFLLSTELSPLQRIDAFVTHAGQAMAKFEFRRGCLVGNLLQESPQLPDDFLQKLKTILYDWESRIALCLEEARQAGDIVSTMPTASLAQIFWSGWEGAVMRAKLFRSAGPLDQFWAYFRHTLVSPVQS